MNTRPTPETDALRDLYENHEYRATVGDIWELCEFFERWLNEAREELAAVTEQRDEAREYADKLAEGLPDGMLPKDVEVLREANLGLATELTAVTEQRDRLAEEIRLTIMENLHLADGDKCTLKRLKDAIGFDAEEKHSNP
jgi:hypothetical protein